MHKTILLFLSLAMPNLVLQVQAMDISVNEAAMAAREAAIKQCRLNSDLQVAAFKGEYGRAKTLLAQGAEFNPKEPVYYLGFEDALSIATIAKEEEICRLLIAKGADVNKADWKGQTPLMCASAVCGEKEYDEETPYRISTLLLDHGADVNAQSISGSTALIKANRAQDEKTCDLLIARGAHKTWDAIIAQAKSAPKKELSPNQQRYLASKLPHTGASKNPYAMELLLAVGAHRYDKLETADGLWHAIANNRVANCKLMLEHGVNPDVTFAGYTGLMTAAAHHYNTDKEVWALLIKHSNLALKVNGESRNIDLALHKTINTSFHTTNSRAIAQLLLEHGANPNALIDGTTPLMRVVDNNEAEICQLFLEHGANIAIVVKNANGPVETAMIKASRNSKDKVLESLIIHSRFPACPLPDLQDSQYRTRLRLWLIKQVCPALPKDLKAFILSLDPDMWQDACRTPLRMHEKKYNDLQYMPSQVVSKGIRHGAFEPVRTINEITVHKMACLKPLMDYAAEHVRSAIMLNSALLEQNYGERIREVIRKDCLDNTEKKDLS